MRPIVIVAREVGFRPAVLGGLAARHMLRARRLGWVLGLDLLWAVSCTVWPRRPAVTAADR